MKRILMPLTLLFAMGVLCTSCLGDSDEEYTYYDDTAITGFSLGTLNRNLYLTTDDGRDSIAKTTVTGSNYRFYIDQEQCRIFNTDSLPYGTDVEKVICTVSTKNAGTVVIKHPQNDSIMFYTSSDSIDFSVPRTFIVYSQNGKNFRQYDVRVNAHKESGDEMVWKQFTAEEGQAAMQQANLKERMEMPVWDDEQLDSDPSLLPTEDITVNHFTLRTNSDVQKIVVAGNRSRAVYPDDTLAVVWSKLVEYGEVSHPHPWIYHNPTGNRFALPRLKSLTTVCYDDCILALGITDDATMSNFYVSRDGGITWKTESTYPLPDGIQATEQVTMEVDEDNFLWITTDNNTVWRGRVNRLGWEDPQKIFTRH
jgi:hypothetical protein